MRPKLLQWSHLSQRTSNGKFWLEGQRTVCLGLPLLLGLVLFVTSKILRQGMETRLICKLCILNLMYLPLSAWHIVHCCILGTISRRDQIITILGFVTYMVSNTITQPCKKQPYTLYYQMGNLCSNKTLLTKAGLACWPLLFTSMYSIYPRWLVVTLLNL